MKASGLLFVFISEESEKKHYFAVSYLTFKTVQNVLIDADVRNLPCHVSLSEESEDEEVVSPVHRRSEVMGFWTG